MKHIYLGVFFYLFMWCSFLSYLWKAHMNISSNSVVVWNINIQKALKWMSGICMHWLNVCLSSISTRLITLLGTLTRKACEERGRTWTRDWRSIAKENGMKIKFSFIQDLHTLKLWHQLFLFEVIDNFDERLLNGYQIGSRHSRCFASIWS